MRALGNDSGNNMRIINISSTTNSKNGVLIKVIASGICGTDLHRLDHNIIKGETILSSPQGVYHHA